MKPRPTAAALPARHALQVAARRAAKAQGRRGGMRKPGAFFTRGGYEGARTDLRELMGWTPALGSADADTLGDLPALRARTRDAERNQPLASGALLTKLDNIVGAGLTPSAQIDADYLGLDRAAAEAWEREAERVFSQVTSRRSFDVAGRNTFAQLQRLALRARMSGGDAFAVRRFVPRPGDVLATKVQLLEADRCCNPDGRMNDQTLKDGVALDEYGCATGFWFASHQPNEYEMGAGMPTFTFVPAVSEATGMPLVLHVIEQLRPGQTRGVPELATVLLQLKQIDRLISSELAASVISSFFTVFVKKAAGVTDGAPLDDLEDADTEGLVVNDRTMKLGQGGIVELEEGESIETANPGRPNAQVDPFVTALAKFIGVALGIPGSMVVKTFNASYSASRAELLEAWRTFETQQDWLVSTFCQPVYEWVIAEAVARGVLQAPGFDEDPLIRAAYLGTMWAGPVATQLDPLKEVTAAARRVQFGVSTRAIEAMQLTGQNWRRVHDQLVKERDLRVADGLDPKEIIIPGLGGMVAVDQSPKSAPGDQPKDDPTSDPPVDDDDELTADEEDDADA